MIRTVDFNRRPQKKYTYYCIYFEGFRFQARLTGNGKLLIKKKRISFAEVYSWFPFIASPFVFIQSPSVSCRDMLSCLPVVDEKFRVLTSAFLFQRFFQLPLSTPGRWHPFWSHLLATKLCGLTTIQDDILFRPFETFHSQFHSVPFVILLVFFWSLATWVQNSITELSKISRWKNRLWSLWMFVGCPGGPGFHHWFASPCGDAEKSWRYECMILFETCTIIFMVDANIWLTYVLCKDICIDLTICIPRCSCLFTYIWVVLGVFM